MEFKLPKNSKFIELKEVEGNRRKPKVLRNLPVDTKERITTLITSGRQI